MFDIPIVLILFRRKDTLERIVERIREVKPRKIYLLSDAGRDKEEQKAVKEVRQTVEQLIDWPCKVIKHYAKQNRGVYQNIGLGAKWVFQRESKAIFLEDDNLPEVSFFYYCEALLERYEKNQEVLWICGTNYLEEYHNAAKTSYMFTHNLLPCGWASWSKKFLTHYDFQFRSVEQEQDINQVKGSYLTRALYKQESTSIRNEYLRGVRENKYRSWDYHMIYSLRRKNLFGISPATNLIKNIGVDGLAEHGGNSYENIMTKRFCGMDSKPLDLELVHPKAIAIDPVYERKIEKLITRPLKMRIINRITDVMRKLFHIPNHMSTKEFLLKGNRNHG